MLIKPIEIWMVIHMAKGTTHIECDVYQSEMEALDRAKEFPASSNAQAVKFVETKRRTPRNIETSN